MAGRAGAAAASGVIPLRKLTSGSSTVTLALEADDASITLGAAADVQLRRAGFGALVLSANISLEGVVTSNIVLAAVPTARQHVVTKAYVDTEIPVQGDVRFVNVAGDVMTGNLTLAGPPSAPLHAATKQYVDNLVHQLANAGRPSLVKFSAAHGLEAYRPGLTTGDGFGVSIACLGDIDGDGNSDTIVGTGNGAVVLRIAPDGRVRDIVRLVSPVGGFAFQTACGQSVAGLGDVNGDGVPDAAMGCQYDGSAGVTNLGLVLIMFLRRDGSAASAVTLSAATVGGLFGTPAAATYTGEFVTGPGDINGDQVPDIVFTCGNGPSGPTWQNAWCVALLSRTGGVVGGLLITHASVGYVHGLDVAAMGDHNGDGVPDLLVGGNWDNTYGAVAIIHLGASGTTVYVKNVIRVTPVSVTGLGRVDLWASQFGYGVSAIGDVDGDGIVDIAVGALEENSKSGAAYIILLNATAGVKSAQRLSRDGPGIRDTSITNAYFGRDVCSCVQGFISLSQNVDLDDGGPITGTVYTLRIGPTGVVAL